jgi:hypothetical protein
VVSAVTARVSTPASMAAVELKHANRNSQISTNPQATPLFARGGVEA